MGSTKEVVLQKQKNTSDAAALDKLRNLLLRSMLSHKDILFALRPDYYARLRREAIKIYIQTPRKHQSHEGNKRNASWIPVLRKTTPDELGIEYAHHSSGRNVREKENATITVN